MWHLLLKHCRFVTVILFKEERAWVQGPGSSGSILPLAQAAAPQTWIPGIPGYSPTRHPRSLAGWVALAHKPRQGDKGGGFVVVQKRVAFTVHPKTQGCTKPLASSPSSPSSQSPGTILFGLAAVWILTSCAPWYCSGGDTGRRMGQSRTVCAARAIGFIRAG